MKSTMPYLGVTAPIMRRVCKEMFRNLSFETSEVWQSQVLELFRGARFREEWYAALELTSDRRARGFQRFDILPMYEEMIATAAWWDVVDAIAGRRLGEILEGDSDEMRRAMLAWSKDGNLWKRRSAILCQLHFKEKTDVTFLYRVIEPSIASKEFFLRKAIGWALRSYAWSDPEEISRYVRANNERLSPLSKREALKNVR